MLRISRSLPDWSFLLDHVLLAACVTDLHSVGMDWVLDNRMKVRWIPGLEFREVTCVAAVTVGRAEVTVGAQRVSLNETLLYLWV